MVGNSKQTVNVGSLRTKCARALLAPQVLGLEPRLRSSSIDDDGRAAAPRRVARYVEAFDPNTVSPFSQSHLGSETASLVHIDGPAGHEDQRPGRRPTGDGDGPLVRLGLLRPSNPKQQAVGQRFGIGRLPARSDESSLSAAKDDHRVAQYLGGKEVVKEIYVPGKMVNLVVK